MALKDWESLEKLIEVSSIGLESCDFGAQALTRKECAKSEDPKIYDVFADIILSSQAPSQGPHHIVSVMFGGG